MQERISFDDYMTAAQAAKKGIIKGPTSLVNRHKGENPPPSQKIGGKTFYVECELLEYLEKFPLGTRHPPQSIDNLIKELEEDLFFLYLNLKKGAKGNKTAAQRVRTKSIELSKKFKKFRKMSLDKKSKKPL